MSLIWLPVAIPLMMMAVLIAMDHLQTHLIDGGTRQDSTRPGTSTGPATGPRPHAVLTRDEPAPAGPARPTCSSRTTTMLARSTSS